MRAAFAVGLILAGLPIIAAEHPAAMPASQSQATSLTDALPARSLRVLADRRYTMHGGIRALLIFWIRRDNIGEARFLWREGPDGARGYEMLMGSDPARAPRKINKWGYFSEESTRDGIKMLGFTNAQDEETLADAERSLAAEGAGGFRYKAIKSHVHGAEGRTGVFRMNVSRDLSFRDLDEMLARLAAEVPVERHYALPAGVRGGYLQTIAEIMKASVEWHRTKGATPRVEGRSFPYVYNGGPYVMVLRSSKFLSKATFKDVSSTNVIEGQFRVTNQTTGYRTDFRIDYGTQGDLVEVPVHIVFQPRWWLEVELVLDPAAPR